MPSRVLALTLLAAMFSSYALAQFSERVDVTVANIDVVVTDANGNPVTGLTKDDFVLYEAGVIQEISNFSAVERERTGVEVRPEGAETPGSVARERRRLIVLFLDISDIEPSRRVRFFRSVRAFLDSAFREGDIACVLSWNHRVRITLPPTMDKSLVEAVMESAGSPFGWSASKGLAANQDLAETIIGKAEADAALARQLGLASAADPVAERQFQEFLHGEEKCAALRRKARELRNLLASVSQVDLQMVLVMASDDFPLGKGCQEHDIRRLVDTANSYGVTIHGFHPPGARDTVAGPDAGGYLPGVDDSAPVAAGYVRAFEESGGLHLLARRTGGVSGVGPGDSERLLGRIAQELDAFYSLGYRVQTPGDGKPRKIRVATKNPRYRVRVRDSVVHLSDDQRLEDLVVTNLYLPNVDERSGPAFSVRTGAAKRDGRFRIVPVEVAFDARKLSLVPAGSAKLKGRVSIFVAAGRELGDAGEVTELQKEFVLPHAGDGDAASNVVYEFAVRIRPDTRRLSVVLRDNVSGDTGARVVAFDPSR